jgi:hypothetical protein
MKIILQPYESMKRKRAKDRLDADAATVHRVIRTTPGIAGKNAIAAKTGLSPQRVADVIHRINNGETGHTRVEYGVVKAYGEVKRGWYSMDRKRHHVAMDCADEHSALVEVGVRRSRLVRFAQAQGIRGAEAAVDVIEERLGLSVEAMSQADLEAFEELLIEAADEAA